MNFAPLLEATKLVSSQGIDHKCVLYSVKIHVCTKREIEREREGGGGGKERRRKGERCYICVCDLRG